MKLHTPILRWVLAFAVAAPLVVATTGVASATPAHSTAQAITPKAASGYWPDPCASG